MIRLFVCKMVAYKEYHSIIARVIANCSEKSYPYFHEPVEPSCHPHFWAIPHNVPAIEKYLEEMFLQVIEYQSFSLMVKYCGHLWVWPFFCCECYPIMLKCFLHILERHYKLKIHICTIPITAIIKVFAALFH
jgi:hypothetical protein